MAEGTGTGAETTATTTAVNPAPPAAPAPLAAETLSAAKPTYAAAMLVDKQAANSAAAKLDDVADSGKLRLDEDAAEALIKAVEDAKMEVLRLYDRTTDQLSQPLRFGDNPVAKAISSRFHSIAVSEDAGAARALLDLFEVLGDIGGALEKNRDTTRNADYEAEAAVNKSGGQG